MAISRVLKHLSTPAWVARRPFSAAVLDRIESAVRRSETAHDAELRVALEAGIHLRALLRGQTARQRAIEVFSELRVWDTAHNSGVLIYLQLVDRRIEIVADRGISASVPQQQWDSVCRGMEAAFGEGRFEQGVLAAIDETTALLARNFPRTAAKPDELPDRPAML